MSNKINTIIIEHLLEKFEALGVEPKSNTVSDLIDEHKDLTGISLRWEENEE
jgi:hypothetical protein